jgi:hypothetical protein
MLKKYRPARLVLGGKRPGQPWRPRRYSDLRSQNHRVRWSDRHVDGAKSKDTQRNRARADLRAHVHEAVSPARPPVSLRTYPPIRNPQQSCTTQGSRTFQSLPSRRPAATSRTTWRNTKRGFDTHLQSRAGHLPRLWRGKHFGASSNGQRRRISSLDSASTRGHHERATDTPKHQRTTKRCSDLTTDLPTNAG